MDMWQGSISIAGLFHGAGATGAAGWGWAHYGSSRRAHTSRRAQFQRGEH